MKVLVSIKDRIQEIYGLMNTIKWVNWLLAVITKLKQYNYTMINTNSKLIKPLLECVMLK